MFKIKFGWTGLLMLVLLACSGVPGFTLTVPKEISIEQGKSTLVGLSVNPEGGFAATVQLSVPEAPPEAIITFDPPTTRFRTSVKIEVKPELKPGTYLVKLQASSGGMSKTADIQLTVLTPAFTVSLPNPGNLPNPSLSVDRGASVDSTLTVSRRVGYLGTVGLSLETEEGQPLPAGIIYTFAPASVAGQENTSALKISIDKDIITQPKDYNLRVKARTPDGSSEHLHSFLLKVTNPPNPDFSLAGSTNSLNFTQLGTQEMTITVNRVGGSEDAVGLSLEKADGTPLPVGVSAVFDPTSVDKNTASSKLKITVAPGVKNETLALQVKGTVGTQNRFFKPLSLVVNLQPDFVLNASGTQLTIRQGREDVLDVFVSSVAGFTGDVELTVKREDGSAPPAGVTQPLVAQDKVTLAANGLGFRSVKVAVSRDVAPGSYNLRIEGRKSTAPSDPPRTFAFVLVVKPEVDPDFALTGPLNLDWEDILENKFQFFIGTIRYGSFADPIALEFVSPPASFENLAFGKNTLASTDGATSVSLTPKAAGDFPLVIRGTAGGLVRQISINVKVRNFNIGFYGGRDQVIQAGETAVFDVTRNLSYPFNIKIRLYIKKADGTFTPLTADTDTGTFTGGAEAPDIESITFDMVATDGSESPGLLIPGGPQNPTPAVRVRIKVKAGTLPKALNLRVEGRSYAPAIAGKRGDGELQYRVSDFTINVTQ